MTDIERKQLEALAIRRQRKGQDTSDLGLETKASGTLPAAFTNQTWPDNLDVYPIVSGRGVPAGVFSSSIPAGGWANSAIYAVVNTVAVSAKEAPVDIFRESKEEGGEGELRRVKRHPIRPLLRAPNRNGPEPDAPVAITMRQLTGLNQWNKHVDGNSYWYKARGPFGNVVALWPIPPYHIEPVGPESGDSRLGNQSLVNPIKYDRFISYYKYDPLPGIIPEMRIDPRDIVHFRLGVDPSNYRKGLGPVKMLAREVATDEEASRFTAALLANSAIPGLIVVPASGYVDPDEAQEIKSRMRSEFGSGKQGGVAVLSAGAEVRQFGHDPDKMSLLNIHKHVEERIAAVMNVPAMVAQLGAGLEQSGQFSNFHEAREMMAENTLLPLWMDDGEVMTGQLLPDFTARQDDHLIYDIDRVRALQTDVTAKFSRLQVAVKGGWMTANEARAKVGLAPIEVKEQQVPLTQGEDNRFNLMVGLGLVTANEIRESIGLATRPDGDGLLKEEDPRQFQSEAGSNASADQALNTVEAADEAETLGATGDENRRGAAITESNLGDKGAEKSAALELLLKGLTPNEMMQAWGKARERGMTLAELALEALGGNGENAGD